MPLNVGEMCLFDAHRLHWVDRPTLPEVDPPPGLKELDQNRWMLEQYRNQMSVMVATETPHRPSREEAEQILSQFLQQATPYCWNQANASKPRKAPRPR